MAKSGKRHLENQKSVERLKRYPLEGAVELLESAQRTKFDETVDVAINLGVDPKHADQMVRGAVVLPQGLGKEVRVVVFAKGEKETAGYSFFNLRSGVKFDYLAFKDITLTLNVENLFDKEYRNHLNTADFYNEPGLNVITSLKFSF